MVRKDWGNPRGNSGKTNKFGNVEEVVRIHSRYKKLKNGFSHSFLIDTSLHRNFSDNILSVFWMKGNIFLEALIAIFLISLMFFIVTDFIKKSLDIVYLYEEKEIAIRTFDTILYKYIYNTYIPKEYNGFEVSIINEEKTLTIVLTKGNRKYEKVYEVLYGETKGICGDSFHSGNK